MATCVGYLTIRVLQAAERQPNENCRLHQILNRSFHPDLSPRWPAPPSSPTPKTPPSTLAPWRARNSSLKGINSAGTVVGGSYLSGDNSTDAFSYSGGAMTDLGTLGGDLATPSASTVPGPSSAPAARVAD